MNLMQQIMRNKIGLKYIIPVFIVIILVILSHRQGPYHDGIYEGKSRARYVQEPYVGFVRIEIFKGHLAKIDFKIVDTLNNEIFDGNYEKHYTGNQTYIEQCRHDWKGVQEYPIRLLETQNIERVDAVSGATWSYNIFKQSALIALKNASD